MEKKKGARAAYPKNLLYAVRGPHEDKDPTVVTQDVLAGIEYALTALSERERYVIKARYADRQYLRAIGETLGIKPERTRQIESDALRKLRCPRSMMFMTKGVEGYIGELCQEKYDCGYQAGFDAGYEKGVEDAPQGEVRAGKTVTIMSLPIESLMASNRSNNALSGAGYKRIGDIVNLCRREIIHIKNLGPKQRQEVAAGLRYYGVTETDWNFFRPRDGHD